MAHDKVYLREFIHSSLQDPSLAGWWSVAADLRRGELASLPARRLNALPASDGPATARVGSQATRSDPLNHQRSSMRW
jgi:hypothetical protein